MTTYPIVMSGEEGKLSVKSDRSILDLKCVLLERALSIKDRKIQNLETKVKFLQMQLEHSERRLEMRKERKIETNRITIVNRNNNNNVPNIYCFSISVVLLLGLIKVIKT